MKLLWELAFHMFVPGKCHFLMKANPFLGLISFAEVLVPLNAEVESAYSHQYLMTWDLNSEHAALSPGCPVGLECVMQWISMSSQELNIFNSGRPCSWRQQPQYLIFQTTKRIQEQVKEHQIVLSFAVPNRKKKQKRPISFPNVTELRLRFLP